MPFTEIDAARQVRRGSGFELPLSAGGTERGDGITRGTVVRVANPQPHPSPGNPLESYVAAGIPVGALVKPLGFDIYGFLAVQACDSELDNPIGVAEEAIAVNGTGLIATAGFASVLVTGTVAAGDALYASATSGLASATAGGGGMIGYAAGAPVAGIVTALVQPSPVPDSGPPLPSDFVGCRVFYAGALNIGASNTVILTWNSEEYDTSAIHSLVSLPTRFTIPSGYSGFWRMVGKVFVPAGTDQTALRATKNGVDIKPSTRTGRDPVSNTIQMDDTFGASAGDYLEMEFSNGSTSIIAISHSSVADAYNYAEVMFMGT